MKKITLLLLLMLGFTSFLSAQCLNLTGTNQQWPTGTYTPTTCDGVTPNNISGICYAGEFSKVNVVEGETYVFTSSNPTDFITISDEDGTVALASGENAYVMWVSDLTGVIRFWTHISSACDGDQVSRTRIVTCGTPPTCVAATGITLDDVTIDTASISWTESTSVPTEGYDYFFSEGTVAMADVTDPTAALPAGTLNISFDSLTANTTYTFYVRANCGDGDTSAWAGGTFTTLPSCTNGVANYVRVADCENGNEQFSVDVNLTDMGTAVAYTVSDDQGSPTQPLTDIGTVTFGPYPLGTEVIFTIANDDDETCVMTSPVQTVANCPPANDTCANAIDLTALESPIDGTTVDALDDYFGNDDCGDNTAPDVYYSIVVANGSTLTIGQTVNDYDSKNYIFYGDCDNQNPINCFDDGDYTSTTWVNDTGSEQTVYWVQDGYASNQGTFTLAWSVIACTNAEATYTIVSDCANGEQFLVDVNITSLGSATELSVTDDQGGASQTATDLSTLTFGPYPNNTPVIFTIANTTDSDCTIMSPAQNQVACPPANDTCASAIDLTALESPIDGTTVGALNDYFENDDCGGNTAGDVYYSIVVADGSTLTIGQTVNDYDSKNYIFYGDCDNQNPINCFDDGDYTSTTWVNDTGSEQTVYWVQDGYGSNQGTFTLAWSVISCTNAEATYAIVSDCANGEQFLVHVNITSLGSATELSVTDDQGGASQTVTDLSTLTFGPYPNNTPVIFTIANSTDSDCTIMSPAQNQTACPPANDECSAPMAVTPYGDFDTSYVSTSNLGATHADLSVIPLPTCEFYQFDLYGKDVWYSVVVPEAGSLTFETQDEDGTITDTGLQVFSGTCDALTSLGCSADIGGGNNFSRLLLTGLTPGDTLLVRIWGYNTNAGNFRFAAYDESLLGVSTFDGATFKAYPNPVTNMLNLSYSKNISNVEIFNLLGQQMTMKTINATQAQVDMSMLAAGTYLVKVTSDNQVKTIKIVKQ